MTPFCARRAGSSTWPITAGNAMAIVTRLVVSTKSSEAMSLGMGASGRSGVKRCECQSGGLGYEPAVMDSAANALDWFVDCSRNRLGASTTTNPQLVVVS